MATTGVRERRREQVRNDILEAAWELAERDGIGGLSLRDLAAAVGMRAPSLYTYFDAKAAIYDAMFAQGYEQLDAVYEDLPFEPGDPVGSLTAGIDRYLAFCQASLPRYQLLFTRVVADWEPSPEAYAVSVGSFGRMVERLAGIGITHPDDVDLFTAFTAGLAAQQLANDPGGDRWSRLSRTTAELILARSERSPT